MCKVDAVAIKLDDGRTVIVAIEDERAFIEKFGGTTLAALPGSA